MIGHEPFVAWLDQVPAPRHLVGGKGASLSQLASLGAPVPAAFALTTGAYDLFARHNALPRRAAEVSPGALSAVRATILAGPMPDAIAVALGDGYRTLVESKGDDIALAVRSSGTAEDSTAFSFAGLHDTVLDVRSLAGLELAVRECWASLWSDRAVAYRLERDLAHDESAIAVVVQQLVCSDVAFVAFTSDPVTGARDRVVIDATWGLGESIVAGLVVPDHITIDAEGEVVDYVVGDKHLMVIPGERAGSGTREVAVPRALRSLPSLSHDQAREIAALARRLSLLLDYDADLEGGLKDRAIHLFQARPITTLALAAASGTVRPVST